MQSGTHASVTEVQEALRRLTQAAQRLGAEFGDTLGVRRLMSDVQRLGADLEELGDPRPGHVPGLPLGDLEEIPDREYDASMWSDAEHEGFGAPDRHAP